MIADKFVNFLCVTQDNQILQNEGFDEFTKHTKFAAREDKINFLVFNDNSAVLTAGTNLLSFSLSSHESMYNALKHLLDSGTVSPVEVYAFCKTTSERLNAFEFQTKRV